MQNYGGLQSKKMQGETAHEAGIVPRVVGEVALDSLPARGVAHAGNVLVGVIHWL